jgi:hypothetical protein
MTEHRKELLLSLSKEQLIFLIEQMHHSLFLICETCVDESKCHIESETAVERIRDYIYTLPSIYHEKEFKAYIDMKMGKISPLEYRRILGFE